MLQKHECDTVFFGPMIGELGWACSRWHAYARFRRFTEFGHCRSIAADYDWRFPLYADFIDEFLPLPDWFTQLGLEQDCYEAVQPDAGPGAITPYEVYANLVAHFRQFYNPETTWTIRPPRGVNFFIQRFAKQMWKTLLPTDEAFQYVDSLLTNVNYDVIVLSARGRTRAANRNVPENVWNTVVDRLTKDFTVVITGTPGGSLLANKMGGNIINMIPITGPQGLDILIALLHRASFSVTSQSGPTLISLLCETPSYIIGHEGYRHSTAENWLKAPAMFREVPNHIYAAIEPEQIIEDIYNFHASVKHADHLVEQGVNDCLFGDRDVLNDMMNPYTNVVLHPMNVEWLQKEILNV
jgi:hypothetical protein